MDWNKLRESDNVVDNRNIKIRNDPGFGGTTKSRPAGKSDFSVSNTGSYQGNDPDKAVQTTYKSDERMALEDKVRESEPRNYSNSQKNKLDDLVRRNK